MDICLEHIIVLFADNLKLALDSVARSLQQVEDKSSKLFPPQYWSSVSFAT